MAVIGDVEVYARQHVLHRPVDQHEALLLRQLQRPQDVAGIDRQHHPAHAVRQRHRPYPLLHLALLHVEGGIREILDIAEVVEMRVRDEDGVDVFRRHADFRQHVPRAAPVLHAELVAKVLPVVPVVVADVDERQMSVAADQRVAIGELHVALVMGSIEHTALVVVGDEGIFEHMDRILGHEMLLLCTVLIVMGDAEARRSGGGHRNCSRRD